MTAKCWKMNTKLLGQACRRRGVCVADKRILVTIIVFNICHWRIDASTEGCPDIVQRSSHFAKVHSGTYYLFVDREYYWNDARSACWNMGGEMLSIKDENTMQFIRSVLNSRQLRWFKEGIWLGAHYIRGRWRWTTGVKLKYNNWAPGEPSKLLGLFSVEDCALMRRDDNWRWHDYFCGSLSFHYNYICEFPINYNGHHEAHSGSHLKDNGNLTILTIILTSGGVVLLILLLVFLIVRRRYSYKKLVSQPDVHFNNRNYDLAVHQPVDNPHDSHSSPPPATHQSSSGPSSNLYLDPAEMRLAAYEEVQKPNGATVRLLKDCSSPEESTSISFLYNDDDLGACGGVSHGEREVQAAARLLSCGGGERIQSQEKLCSVSESLPLKTTHIHSNYVHLNGNLVMSSQSGSHVAPVARMTEERKSCRKGGVDNSSGHVDTTDDEENEPSATSSSSNRMSTSQQSESWNEGFS